MKQHRNEITLADIATWPEFNSNALAIKDRATFTQRRSAIELYAGGETLTQIEDQTQVNRRQLYRLIERCTDTHAVDFHPILTPVFHSNLTPLFAV